MQGKEQLKLPEVPGEEKELQDSGHDHGYC